MAVGASGWPWGLWGGCGGLGVAMGTVGWLWGPRGGCGDLCLAFFPSGWSLCLVRKGAQSVCACVCPICVPIMPHSGAGGQ